MKGARRASRERILDVLIARFDLPAAQYRRIERQLMKINDVDILRDLLLAIVKAKDIAAFEHTLQETLSKDGE